MTPTPSGTHPPVCTAKPSRRERVAVVGSGPAGLTAAHYLARTGFSVTLFEALSEAGGMLRWGIPAYRLPRQILDREIREILAAGIDLKYNTCIGREVLLEELEIKFDAVFLAVGAQRSVPLGIPGENAEGSFGAVEWLKAHSQRRGIKIGKKVAVIGGGIPPLTRRAPRSAWDRK